MSSGDFEQDLERAQSHREAEIQKAKAVQFLILGALEKGMELHLGTHGSGCQPSIRKRYVQKQPSGPSDVGCSATRNTLLLLSHFRRHASELLHENKNKIRCLRM